MRSPEWYRGKLVSTTQCTHPYRDLTVCTAVLLFRICFCKLVEFLFYEVYYESKRKPKIKGITKCRCDERLQTKTEEFTRLPYTGLVLVLEHLKIETRLIAEMIASVISLEIKLKKHIPYSRGGAL